MRRRHEVSEAEWERLEPLLPPRKAGRRRRDDRQVVNGILWKLATGAPWRDLPERYGPWPTVYTRFWRWTRAGVWARIFAAVQRRADAAGQVDWTVHCIAAKTLHDRQPTPAPTPRPSYADLFPACKTAGCGDLADGLDGLCDRCASDREWSLRQRRRARALGISE